MTVLPFVMPPPSLFDPKKTCLVTDLDGCLVNTWEMLQIYLWDRHHIWVDPEVNTQFNVGRGLHPTLHEFYKTPEDLNDALWAGLWSTGLWYQTARPYYDYWQALLHWYDAAEIEMEFLTARPSHLWDSTLSWLNRWGFDILPQQLTLTESSQEKIEHLSELAQCYDQLVFIDDKVSTILDAARAGLGAHCKLLLFAQPWNSAQSPDWDGFIIEGMQALDHPEFDVYLGHGFDFGFRRLTETQISKAIVTGLG